MRRILDMRRLDNNLLVVAVVIFISLFRSSSSLKIGETCSTSNNKCDSGLRCGTCPASGNTRPRCTRIQPLSPTSKVNGLPFNRYTWLTTHNSYAVSGTKSPTGSPVLGPANQEDDVTSQLQIQEGDGQTKVSPPACTPSDGVALAALLPMAALCICTGQRKDENQLFGGDAEGQPVDGEQPNWLVVSTVPTTIVDAKKGGRREAGDQAKNGGRRAVVR